MSKTDRLREEIEIGLRDVREGRFSDRTVTDIAREVLARHQRSTDLGTTAASETVPALGWKLMIDDERDPGNVYWHVRRDPIYLQPGWRIARTVDEAIALIDLHGYPELISFDHDLGLDPLTKDELPSGMHLAKRLVDRDMDTADMPEDFRFVVHSMNGNGADNITGLLDGYMADRTPGVPRPRIW